jgi:hypothetical protein
LNSIYAGIVEGTALTTKYFGEDGVRVFVVNGRIKGSIVKYETLETVRLIGVKSSPSKVFPTG